jgi:SAM-dependent methyltransferase
MPSEYIQKALIRAITRYTDDKTISILDVSCGDGATLKKLRALGYTNLAGTLYGEDQEVFDYSNIDYQGIKIIKNVNLLASLPFETESVDVVINSELLEHMENHRHAVSELTRIVKPNGLLVFETPNVMRLQSRFNFFLSGFHKPRTPFPPYHGPFVEHLKLHSFPVYLPILDYFLYHHGMRLEKITWNRWKVFPILLLLVFFPLIILNSIFFLWKQEIIDKPAKFHLFKLVHHPAVLLCNVLILTYRKLT